MSASRAEVPAPKQTPRPPRPSRRELHTSRTRLALVNAAIELFATEGYDTTTTDEIAERAGVSPRTFFRYFPTKESVLFLRERDWIYSLADLYVAQKSSMSDIEAMRASFVLLAPGIAADRHSMHLYEKAVASSPTLRGREEDRRREATTVLAAAVASGRGLKQPDEQSELLAGVAVLTYRRAFHRWLAGPAGADLRATIAEEFALLLDIFADERGQQRARRPTKANAR